MIIEEIDLRYNMFWNWVRWNCLDLYNNSIEPPKIDKDSFFRQGFDASPKWGAVNAVEQKGIDVLCCFSGWGGKLTETEEEVIEGIVK